ncbi:MAG: hypothetical protein AABX31_00685 [Nanoarchaeota archaeon]
MLQNPPLMLPEFKNVFDCEVYSTDFMTTDHIDMSNFDANVLRRGFLVLSRYSKPTIIEVASYLQKTIEQHMGPTSKHSPLDVHFSPLVAKLEDQVLFSLLKGDSQKIKTLSASGDLVVEERDGQQYLQAHYFTVPAPLYISQGKKATKPEWYHDAINNKELQEKGLRSWFIIRLNYAHLLEPAYLAAAINQSALTEKEGVLYVMENVCNIFSPPLHFAQLKDSSARKIREAALEALVDMQKERNLVSGSRADIILN